MPVVYSEFVLKVGDSSNFSEQLRADMLTLKQDKSHGIGAMHLKDIIKTKHVQPKPRISCQRFNQNVF